MKSLFYNLLYKLSPVLVVLSASLLSLSVASAAPLEVVTESEPLFTLSQIIPGAVETKTLQVTNNSADTQAIYIGPTNAADSGLASGMRIVVSEGATIYTDTTFADFFASSGVLLGELNPGASRTYLVTAAMPTSTPATYQGTSLMFDMSIGFAGTDVVTVISGGGGGGNGGGGRRNGNDDNMPLDNNGLGGANVLGASTGPTPMILGDQVSVIPQGAPNTGARAVGGTVLSQIIGLGLLLLTMVGLIAARKLTA